MNIKKLINIFFILIFILSTFKVYSFDNNNNGDSSNESITCTLCTFLACEVEMGIDNNQTESYILNNLESYCSDYPLSVGKECDSMAKRYGKSFYQFSKSGASINGTCEKLQLCNRESTIYYDLNN